MADCPCHIYEALIERLRADLAAKDLLLRSLADRLAKASEVLSRAAERGKVCARCRQAFTLEDLPK